VLAPTRSPPLSILSSNDAPIALALPLTPENPPKWTGQPAGPVRKATPSRPGSWIRTSDRHGTAAPAAATVSLNGATIGVRSRGLLVFITIGVRRRGLPAFITIGVRRRGLLAFIV